MRSRLIALALATLPALALSTATPAAAQSRADEDRFQAASRRFDNEVAVFQRERDRYLASRSRGYRDDSSYGGPPRYDDRDPYATDYDAYRYYRDDPRYQERRLTADDQVYRGSDGRYYCRRSDGTTGLIIGAGAGALIGNAIDGGRRRTAGTLVGGALGALLGRTIEQNQQEVRCR